MNPTDFDTSAMGLCGRVELDHPRTLYSPTMQDLSSNPEKFVTSWKWVLKTRFKFSLHLIVMTIF